MNPKQAVRGSWVLLPILLGVTPSLAAGADAVLHEVTEEVVFMDDHFMPVDPRLKAPAFRMATSAIEGTAAVGSAICPLPVPCSIVALGSNQLRLIMDAKFGTGPFSGKFALVLNEPGTTSRTHVPAVVFAAGAFAGQMDLAPAILFRATNGAAGAPLGTITGGQWCLGDKCFNKDGTINFNADGTLAHPDGTLNATFRIPFTAERMLKDLTGEHQEEGLTGEHEQDSRGEHQRDSGDERVGHRRGGAGPVFYLVDGERQGIRPNDRSLGVPTVRVELDFLR